MSTWIKMRKSLWNDPRVLSVAAKLSQSKQAVIGGLFALWSLADTHGESFKGLSTQVLDTEVGIVGFCAALPRDWFRERSNGVELPNYSRHNGTTAKTRALVAKRVGKHRRNDSNADVTQEPLPDQTRPEPEKELKKNQPPTPGDVRALAGYASECCQLTIPVGEVSKLLKASGAGLVGVVTVFEHLASRDPWHWDSVKNPVAFVRSLIKRAAAGEALEAQGEYEPFENWRARREAEIARVA